MKTHSKKKKRTGKSHFVAQWKNTTQRKIGPAWERVRAAYLDGRIETGRSYSVGDLRKLCGVPTAGIDGVQMDLAFHRAPLRLVDTPVGRLTVRAA